MAQQTLVRDDVVFDYRGRRGRVMFPPTRNAGRMTVSVQWEDNGDTEDLPVDNLRVEISTKNDAAFTAERLEGMSDTRAQLANMLQGINIQEAVNAAREIEKVIGAVAPDDVVQAWSKVKRAFGHLVRATGVCDGVDDL